MRTARSVLAVAALLALGGCAAAETRALTEGDRTLLVQTVSDSGGDAAIEGDLGLNDMGCFGLAGAEGQVTVAIWPQGFDLTSDGQVRTAQGTVLEVGAPISGGGGFVDFRSGYPDLASRCLPDADDSAAEVVVLASVE